MLAFYSSAIIISVIGFVFMEPILRLLGATDDIMIYARQYFIIILAGNVFSTGFSSIIRAEGKMTYALLIWLIPTGINIIADAVLIFGLKMGVRGAALGTVLCQFTSFLMSVIFFTKMSCQEFKSIKIKVKTILEIIGIGLPTLVQMGSLSIMTMALNKILSSVAGTMGINTFAYISKALTFGLVPINALSLATAPIIGYNYGAKNKGRINEAFSFSLILCLVYSIVAIIVTQLSAGSMIGIFTSDAQLIEYGEAGLKIISFALLFAPLPLLSGSFFQSIGKKAPAFLLNASTLIFIFPLAIILSNANGMNGVWQAFIPAYALAAALSAAVLFAHYRKYKY